MSRRIGVIVAAAAIAALAVSIAACRVDEERASVDVNSISKSAEPGGYTKAFVEQALRRYEATGRESTVAHYNTPGSVDGDWYVFIIDEGGAIVSHATRPERVGLTFDDMVDVTGYHYGADFAAATGSGRWVDYTYLNPTSGGYEMKRSWVVNRDGLIFGSGWYDRSVANPLPSKTDEPDKYTKAFVERALRRYETNGREGTIAYYNTPASIDGDWYVFIVDEDGSVVSHAARPDSVGLTFDDMVDVTGYDYGADIAAATGSGRWVSYTHMNPASGIDEKKHSWVVRHDGLIFGSGWYEK